MSHVQVRAAPFWRPSAAYGLPEPSKTLCCRCLPRLGHFITQIPMCGVKAVGYLRIIEACHLADLGSMHLAHPELWIRSVCAVAPALKSLECMSNMSGYEGLSDYPFPALTDYLHADLPPTCLPNYVNLCILSDVCNVVFTYSSNYDPVYSCVSLYLSSSFDICVCVPHWAPVVWATVCRLFAFSLSCSDQSPRHGDGMMT
jgi:hypothetical protein